MADAAIQNAETLKASSGESAARKRIIYQSEALFANKAGTTTQPAHNIKRVQSVNYSFTVPRTDVNQYGTLGQIERVITEVPSVSLDFSYHMNGIVNELILLGTNGANGSSFGFLRDINNPNSNFYQMDFKVGLTGEGVDYNSGAAPTKSGIIVPNGFLSSYSWTGSVGDVPTATVNAESTEMKVDDTASNFPIVPAFAGTKPVVLRPGNVLFNSSASSVTPPDSGGDLPVLGVDVLHVQSFTVSIDIPRESISRLGDKFEFAKVITFPMQATMSVEAIVSSQAATNLELIVGAANAASPDPGYNIDILCKKPTIDNDVQGIDLRFKNAKIEGHSISSSIGSNKSITLDYAVQVDAGGLAYGSAGAGFFIQQNTSV
jgi:hypothetical protein